MKYIFTVEAEAYEGVKRIAKKAALDFEKVGGELPEITETLPLKNSGKTAIVFATLGKSPFLDKLSGEGKFDPSAINGKREVYQIKYIDDKTLLVCGSDKRGTIYGIFALSEYIGVSPLHFWGDVEPVCRSIEIKPDIETVSKEPSVKYRGFFINDEWPCFGEWTFGRYGGFTAEMYDNVFELLLRLKGNYLWPAMWTSNFPLDGPGHLNEELADIYGVVMGASHHEPCLRASEEWDIVKGPGSEYGNDWNYYTNKNGLLKYWEDGLKRSGKYEKLITIGMRGERDSTLYGDAALKDNIDVLKDIIKNQRELIKKHVNDDLDSVPQVLAVYKEVEAYFHGDEQTEGLKDWDELKNIIFMLCEDNFGFMRTLPSPEMRKGGSKEHKGGFGMYYHFDYHGDPISYEWMPCVPFEKTWEQMCTAYDYGIKDIWIVNVGDLKFNETLLAYFMELAYDFEKWGTNAPNSTDAYTAFWLEKTFPAVNAPLRERIKKVFTGLVKMNALRRPEALNSGIFHPCHYFEADRVLAFAQSLEMSSEEIYEELKKAPYPGADAYYSMIGFPVRICVNLFQMHLYAGKNRHYANQGKKIANDYAGHVTLCIKKDQMLCEEFASFKGGKWKGMELEQHIGFVKWNEDNSRFPLRLLVEPARKPRLVVSRKAQEPIYTRAYAGPETIKIDDFLYAGNEQVVLEIANDGIGSVEYVIEPQEQCDWLKIFPAKGTVESQEDILLTCDRQKLTKEEKTLRLLIKDSETVVAVDIRAKAVDENLPPKTFLSNNGVIVINANDFCCKKDAGGGSFTELKNYGRTGCGMKVYPTTANFGETDEKPALSYRFVIDEPGEHIVEIWTTPTNPVRYKTAMRFALSKTEQGESKIITVVPPDFRAGESSDPRWAAGVLDNIRITKAALMFEKGVNQIWIGAMEAGLIVERILIYREENAPLTSYLGPISF